MLITNICSLPACKNNKIEEVATTYNIDKRTDTVWNKKFGKYKKVNPFKDALTTLKVGESLTIYREEKKPSNDTPVITVILRGDTKKDTFYITQMEDRKKIIIDSRVKLENVTWKSINKDSQLAINSKIPDIFSPKLKIKSVTIDGKVIPLKHFIPQNHYFDYTTPEYVAKLNKLTGNNLLDRILRRKGILTRKDFEDNTLEIKLQYELTLKDYNKVKLENVGTVKDIKSYEHYKRFTAPTRNYPADNKMIQEIVKELKNGKSNVLEIAKECYDYTKKVLNYHDDELHLNPDQVIVDGRGDCDDYTDVFITLMRAAGIPAKYSAPTGVAGNIIDSDILGTIYDLDFHAWPDFLVPLKNGSFKWVSSDPTWGDNEKDSKDYFQLKDNRHFYKLGINFETWDMKDPLLIEEQTWKIL